jgi:hypothetical protein
MNVFSSDFSYQDQKSLADFGINEEEITKLENKPKI